MDEKQKQQIFQMNQARAERDTLVNKGIPTPLGNGVVYVKALPWTKCNLFDDAIAKAFTKFSDITTADIALDGKGVNLQKVLDTLVTILQSDLPKIAEVATNGEVTMQRIEESEATRDDVIQIVLKAFEVNYSSLKNLMALAKGLR